MARISKEPDMEAQDNVTERAQRYRLRRNQEKDTGYAPVSSSQTTQPGRMGRYGLRRGPRLASQEKQGELGQASSSSMPPPPPRKLRSSGRKQGVEQVRPGPSGLGRDSREQNHPQTGSRTPGGSLKRDRPSEASTDAEQLNADADDSSVSEPPPKRRKRGRPKKHMNDQPEERNVNGSPQRSQKRGSTPVTTATPVESDTDDEELRKEVTSSPLPYMGEWISPEHSVSGEEAASSTNCLDPELPLSLTATPAADEAASTSRSPSPTVSDEDESSSNNTATPAADEAASTSRSPSPTASDEDQSSSNNSATPSPSENPDTSSPPPTFPPNTASFWHHVSLLISSAIQHEEPLPHIPLLRTHDLALWSQNLPRTHPNNGQILGRILLPPPTGRSPVPPTSKEIKLALRDYRRGLTEEDIANLLQETDFLLCLLRWHRSASCPFTAPPETGTSTSHAPSTTNGKSKSNKTPHGTTPSYSPNLISRTFTVANYDFEPNMPFLAFWPEKMEVLRRLLKEVGEPCAVLRWEKEKVESGWGVLVPVVGGSGGLGNGW